MSDEIETVTVSCVIPKDDLERRDPRELIQYLGNEVYKMALRKLDPPENSEKVIATVVEDFLRRGLITHRTRAGIGN